MATMKEGWTEFKTSFKLDKRFLYVILLEILLLVLIFVGAQVLNSGLQGALKGLDEFQGQMEALGGITSTYALNLQEKTQVEISMKIFKYTILFAIYLIIIWTIVKNFIYNQVNKIQKFTFRMYWRFLLVSAVWGFIAFMIYMLLLNIMFNIVEASFEISFMSRIWLFFEMLITLLILYWLTIVLLTYLVRTGNMLTAAKGLWNTGVKGCARFIWPLIYTLLAFVIVNLVMYVYMMIGPYAGFLPVFTVLLLLYFTWVRFYYTQTIEKTTSGTASHRPPETHEHPAPAHKARRQTQHHSIHKPVKKTKKR